MIEKPATPKERLKDLVGKRARLLRRIVTRGGVAFEMGQELDILGSWRRTFSLAERKTDGRIDWDRSISGVHRSFFAVF